LLKSLLLILYFECYFFAWSLAFHAFATSCLPQGRTKLTN
jgi:hypothetical protein